MIKLKPTLAAAMLALALPVLSPVAIAKSNVIVGGQEMFPTKTIVE